MHSTKQPLKLSRSTGQTTTAVFRPNVVVDSAKVQESGLLKDTIILDVPDEVGQFDTVLVRRATAKIKNAISTGWDFPRALRKDA